jgi:hypothetical protein
MWVKRWWIFRNWFGDWFRFCGIIISPAPSIRGIIYFIICRG